MICDYVNSHEWATVRELTEVFGISGRLPSGLKAGGAKGAGLFGRYRYRRSFALWPAIQAGILVAGALSIGGCSTGGTCTPGPELQASWPGHLMLLPGLCGAALYRPMTAVTAPATPAIRLHVGDQLTLRKGAHWDNYEVSQATTDNPGVLRVAGTGNADVIGVFTATGSGIADIGAHTNFCTSVGPPCSILFVQVEPRAAADH